MSILLPCVVGWACTFLSVEVFRQYAFGLFIWMPFIMGVSSTLIFALQKNVKRKTLRNNSFLTLLIFCAGLLFFAWEGIICLLMAAPIGFLSTYLGFLLGARFTTGETFNSSSTKVLLLILSIPGVMAFDYNTGNEDELRSVTTSVEINAPMEAIWKNVISFPELCEPHEFIFKTGIAYPINATIKGSGVGAIRHCNFSTGSFVEPITTWNEPNLLGFSVEEQPEPMKEISFYDIHPNHLHGFWVSKRGQFSLKKLPNGHTMLEGTTWYVNKIKPGFYWTLWSDYIIHKIHQRVLNHIKNESE